MYWADSWQWSTDEWQAQGLFVPGGQVMAWWLGGEGRRRVGHKETTTNQSMSKQRTLGSGENKSFWIKKSRELLPPIQVEQSGDKWVERRGLNVGGWLDDEQQVWSRMRQRDRGNTPQPHTYRQREGGNIGNTEKHIEKIQNHNFSHDRWELVRWG